MTQQQLSKMSMDELRSMRDLIQREIEDRAQEIKYELRIGDKVRVNHRSTMGVKFIVSEIKRKKAIVENAHGMRYNVSLHLIEKAE